MGAQASGMLKKLTSEVSYPSTPLDGTLQVSPVLAGLRMPGEQDAMKVDTRKAPAEVLATSRES